MGIMAWRTNAGTAPGSHVRLAPPGCPDIIGCLKDGRFLGIEVKRPKGIVSVDQAAFMLRIREQGGVAFVARDLSDVVRLIEE